MNIASFVSDIKINYNQKFKVSHLVCYDERTYKVYILLWDQEKIKRIFDHFQVIFATNINAHSYSAITHSLLNYNVYYIWRLIS